MAIVVCVVHDLLIFVRRDLKITDGVVDEFFQAGCGAAGLFHCCSPWFGVTGCLCNVSVPYQSVAKAIPGFFNCRLAKDASANLTIFLALSEPAKFGTTSLCRASPFFNGLITFA
jgi:hypothetical protein